MSALLEVSGLTVAYGPGCAACAQPLREDEIVCEACGTVFGCRNVGFELAAGEALGIVGESGSGKSTALAAVALDAEATDGSVRLDGDELLGVTGARRRRLRAQQIGIVYQRAEQGLALDVSAGGNVAGRLIGAGTLRFGELRERSQAMLGAVELDENRLDDPARAFSGGMRQRVQLAKALVNQPRVLLLDEPTTGLDVSVQAKILDLIRRMRLQRGLSMVIVSHDLAVIRMLAERVLVMRRGRVVEAGLTDQVLGDPHHPYTQLLVSAQLT
ncbi:MAG: putative phosphonate transport system ATP-binding protein [Solirubrobacteraceae bacterium]